MIASHHESCGICHTSGPCVHTLPLLKCNVCRKPMSRLRAIQHPMFGSDNLCLECYRWAMSELAKGLRQ